MTKFTDAWKQHQERISTENGGVTFNTSADSNVDLFFKIGAMRKQPVERLHQMFAKAFGENPYIATRILLWARDVRGGAGERKVFRDILQWLEVNDKDVLSLVLPKIPELGRWDDLLVFKTKEFKDKAFSIYEAALRARNGLAAKWMPRERSANAAIAHELREFLGLTPRQYRKVAVQLTDVVENKMCAKDWESINYSHVPSLAQARYKKAFLKHDADRYNQYGKDLVKAITNPEQAVPGVKINAGAVYPYDVIKGVVPGVGLRPGTNGDVIRAQWAALPNYMGEKSILPVIDVSGSMHSPVSGSTTCMDVAVSLGLYMATKNKGDFNNMFMTFSTSPDLVALKGDDIISHINQISTAHWSMSTDIGAAFARILAHARTNRVAAEDMPEFIVVLSDMEFNGGYNSQTAYENYKSQFAAAGYRAPQIIWWNIQSRQDQSPVKFDQSGTAMVSGFSPSIVKNILGGVGISPIDMMLKVVMDPKYDLDLVQAA